MYVYVNHDLWVCLDVPVASFDRFSRSLSTRTQLHDCNFARR